MAGPSGRQVELGGGSVKQLLSRTGEAWMLDVGDCGIDRRRLFAQVVPTHQDRSHRALMRAIVSQGPRTGRFQASLTKPAG